MLLDALQTGFWGWFPRSALTIIFLIVATAVLIVPHVSRYTQKKGYGRVRCALISVAMPIIVFIIGLSFPFPWWSR